MKLTNIAGVFLLDVRVEV